MVNRRSFLKSLVAIPAVLATPSVEIPATRFDESGWCSGTLTRYMGNGLGAREEVYTYFKPRMIVIRDITRG